MNSEMIIRTASEADAPALLEIYAPYVERTAITFEYEVPSVDEFASRIRNTLQKYPYLVAEKGGRILGYAYAGPFHDRPAYDWSVETCDLCRYFPKNIWGSPRKLHDALEQALQEQGILNMNAASLIPPQKRIPE